jgi:glucose-1-phosphate thymidylyltransferase
MKIIISLTRKDTPLSSLASKRPEPLLNVAGNTILGHILILLQPIATDGVILAIGQNEEAIKNWVTENFPALNVQFVNVSSAGRSKSILACQNYLDKGDVLVVSGRSLVETEYANIPEQDAHAVIITRPDEPESDAGMWWFSNGRSLINALQANTNFNDTLKYYRNEGDTIVRKPAKQWLDASTPEALLQANKRLLGLGRGITPNAIDRSYAEDFTVLPPVYIAEDAMIESGVIGPYAHIGAGATIKNAIISNSIIDAQASVENCILAGSIVGENTRVSGRTQKLFIGDDSTVQLT